MLEAIRFVDLGIPENTWEQKETGIRTYTVDVVCMGGWRGTQGSRRDAHSAMLSICREPKISRP